MFRLLLLAALLAVPTTVWAQDAQVALARQHVEENARQFSAPAGAASEARVTAAYRAPQTGLTHVYLRQTINGIDLRGGDVTVTLRPDNSVLHAAGRFIYDVGAARGAAPALTAESAAEITARHVGFQPREAFQVIEHARGTAQRTVLSDGGVAKKPVEASLIFEPTEQGPRLAWDVTFHEPVDHHVWSIRVDAASGEVLAQNDYVVHDHFGDAHGNPVGFHQRDARSPVIVPETWHAPLALPEVDDRGGVPGGTYRVYPDPIESPIHAQNRVLVSNPADPDASPYGWHDTDGTPEINYTTSRGNNVFAYVDANNQNQPNGTDAVPDGGEDLIFDFPIDFTQAPSTYRLAAVTNLFFWNNRIHDILWHYGFDEPAGNFQAINYSGQGLGNDWVRAEAQDGGGMNNANFFTPVDGQPPRMQMYLWNTATPHIDGDFDNGVIAHEYAHGWSIRLTGGPNNVGCLWNQEQMGEGWSDYLGLILTMRFSDYAEQRRGIGTFVLNQPTDGQGIRPAPYSTSFAVNNYTYGNLPQMAVPHGVGFVWATMLWDMTWDLIDIHGFSTDFVHGQGGNNIALRLVSEAMKLQPCSPGFIDGRDAILAADQALYDGANTPAIWLAFARRGLGYSASQGSSSSSNDGTEAFDLPPGMERSLHISSYPSMVPAGEFVTYEVELVNGPGIAPIDDVELNITLPEGVVYAPTAATEDYRYNPETHTLTLPPVSLETGQTSTRSFVALVNVEGGSEVLFVDDMTDGDAAWQTSQGIGNSNWSLIEDGDAAAWYAQNATTASDQRLLLTEAFVPTPGTVIRFRHAYDIEPNFDGGVVELSVDGGSWQDAGEHFTEHAYNGAIAASAGTNPLAGRDAFSGSSKGYVESVIDLTEFSGQSVRVRFRMATDNGGGYPTFEGWYIDEVMVIDEVALLAQACADVPASAGIDCASRRTPVADALEGSPVIEHEFGEIVLVLDPGEDDTVVLSFTNTGDRPLEAAAGPAGEVEWMTPGSNVQTVEPGETGELVILINAADLDIGSYEAFVTVASNDPDTAVLTLPVYLFLGTVSGEEDAGAMPDGFLLEAPFPNPFRERAELTLRVAESQHVTIALYDVMGREVALIHDGDLSPGAAHGFQVDGARLASGVYLLRVQGEHFRSTERITRVR